MLCDHLVCGLVEQQLQQSLLMEGDLTFDIALTITQAMELATSKLVHTGGWESIGWPSHW